MHKSYEQLSSAVSECKVWRHQSAYNQL